MAIESLTQQSSAFVDSMKIHSTQDGEAADTGAREAKTPEQGDSISISQEARALVATEKQDKILGGSGGSDKESELEATIKRLREEIERLKQEIEELQNSDMPDELKNGMLQEKQAQLAENQQALVEALEKQMQKKNAAETDGVTV